MPLVDQLVEFVIQTGFDNVPPETVSFAKHLCTKVVAAMLTGARTEAGRKIVDYVVSRGTIPEVTAIGTGMSCSMEDAALVNGVTSHAAELEDDQFPSATSDITIFPVVFPIAEKYECTGREFVLASILGLEVMNRVGMFSLSSRGITDLPFYGVLGSTITAGKALKLDSQQLKSALGIALGRSSGYVINFGTDAHYLESGMACRDGLSAALMAKAGMTGSCDLEGWLLTVLGREEFQPEKMLEGLGGRIWRTHEIWIKKYPCCFLTHRHIDMMLEILKETGIGGEEINEVEIDVGPVDFTCNRPDPVDPEDARFSFHHIMAALMIDGDIDSYHFSWEKLADPYFKKARSKVKVRNHRDWPPVFMSGVARITVSMKDGRTIVKEGAEALGGPSMPLTSEQFRHLFLKYTRNALTDDEAEKLWLAINGLEEMENLGPLIERMRGRSGV
jgi:2-methylcitrate dehydratase PrpD